VVLGEMTGVVEDCVQVNFELMSRDTPAEGAVLSFRRVPTQACCRNCAHIFRPDEICWACPACQSAEFEITSGNELYIESIEVE
jgi:hydrogenase nickel incorporation protein HypA/HybF